MIDNVKRKCQYCKTEKYSDFIKKNGKLGVVSCAKCSVTNYSKANKGSNHPNFKHGRDVFIKYKCKHCGTIDKDKFGKWAGRQLLTTCSSCLKETSYKKRKGEDNPIFGRRKGLKYYQDKYPIFCRVESVREKLKIKDKNDPGIEVKCKWCEKWFTPNRDQLTGRIGALEHINNGYSENNFYCSDNCRDLCPLYKLHPEHFLNNLNNSEDIYTSQEYNIWKNEVLTRQLNQDNHNHCEKCDSIDKLKCHHEKPQKTHPHLALDPDNGIICCGARSKNKCHYKYGHKDECNLYSLSKKKRC